VKYVTFIFRLEEEAKKETSMREVASFVRALPEIKLCLLPASW
jgi:hypothetical protein